MNHDIEELTALFRDLGAPDPAQWARSQVKEGINQLHRYLFLRRAWSMIVPDDDQSWIDAEIAYAAKGPGQPYAGVGSALRELIDNGADRQLLGDVVRGMQVELMRGFCYLLEDPGLDDEAVSHIGWCLVETGEDREPTGEPIGGLHESVLETDPTGREMRPREGR